MKGLGFSRYALVAVLAAALLAGCGGSQSPIGAAGAMPQSRAVARAHVIAQRIRTPSPYYKVLYSFSGMPDGASPLASLIEVNGVLYGTTYHGGKGRGRSDRAFGKGTVFSIATTGTEHVLYRFGSPHPHLGTNPQASLIDMGGTLYGTTKRGGHGCFAHGCGTVFGISTSGKLHVLHVFGGSDGANPEASLIIVKGTLYGTTSLGGRGNCSPSYDGCGTVFSVTPSGTETDLHSFGKGSDGRYPEAGLNDVNGRLYGTTYAGGAGSHCGSSPGCTSGPSGGCSNGCGTVFSMTKAGTEKVLHRFGFGSTDGSLANASLIDVGGTLYGTTVWGGPNGEGGGTVFSISTSGTEKILHSFGSGSDGRFPLASLIDVNGTLYGTTDGGGAYGRGTVFSISTSGAEKVLHSFGSGSDGALPRASLIDVNGTLYGTTAGGGAHTGCYFGGCGTVFALTP